MIFEITDGQSIAEFIASLAGDYVIGVDYDGATDSNSDFDEQFTVTVDLTGVDITSLPGVPTITTPTKRGATFLAGDRSVTIDWNAVAGADFYSTGIDGVTNVDVATTQHTFGLRAYRD
ncbi:MAG: hypothetical protein R3C05_22360 [Pirellulaceae bacterium]